MRKFKLTPRKLDSGHFDTHGARDDGSMECFAVQGDIRPKHRKRVVDEHVWEDEMSGKNPSLNDITRADFMIMRPINLMKSSLEHSGK